MTVRIVTVDGDVLVASVEMPVVPQVGHGLRLQAKSQRAKAQSDGIVAYVTHTPQDSKVDIEVAIHV